VNDRVKRARRRSVALSIAGSDPGGGAGIQADLKTFASIGVYGYSAITCLVAQNSSRVERVEPVETAMVAAQIETLAAERKPDTIKTGALGNARIVAAVADLIARLELPAPVVDPVLVSTAGVRLIDRSGERALVARMLPMARIVTPNLAEAQTISGIEDDSAKAVRAMARAIARTGARAVLIKGGHSGSSPAGLAQANDLLYDGREYFEFRASRIAGGGAHGLGCALSAAIAAYLALGLDLVQSVLRAKRYVTAALNSSFTLGEGRALLDHFAPRSAAGDRRLPRSPGTTLRER
jgi:hydroxymethylpyrimidine/phosphomethylpyrimidine kinase